MRGIMMAATTFLLACHVGAQELTPDDLSAFADGVIETMMAEEHVAGVVLGVVRDDRVMLLRGYGLSDVQNDVPVDPATTLFRPGSVTKLFTWVALMQLRDAGKVDFDTDINRYLENVTVPATFEQPITIKHLMTHTPGFEDHVLGLFGRDADSVKPLVTVLQEQMPTRVRPPGVLPSYSNHGVALAGLIVQNVSGEPWSDYIERHILEPLGMAHTTMKQPLPASLAPQMSKGYVYEGGRYREKDFEYVPPAPAGSASASGADMTRFVRMLLNDGEVDGARILAASSAREMREVLFRPDPKNTGIMHGLYETSSHGQLKMGHGGDTFWFHSELVLLPESDLGWFISTNTATGGAVRTAFTREFMDRYFVPPPRPTTDFERTEASRVTGYYGAIRHSHDDLTKIVKLLGPMVISRTPHADLMMTAAGRVTLLDEIAPLTYSPRDSETVVTFVTNESGRATHLYLSSMPVIAFERMTGAGSPVFQNMLLGFSGVVFAWVVIVWTVQRFSRRYVLPESVARIRLTGGWMVYSFLLFVVGFVLTIDGFNDIAYGLSTATQIVLLIPYITATLALLTVLQVPLVFREALVGRVAKFGYLLLAIAGIGFTWFMTYWSVL